MSSSGRAPDLCYCARPTERSLITAYHPLSDRRTGRRTPGIWLDLSLICGLPVTQDENEFEIQLAHDGDNPGLDKYHVHNRCFATWEFERRHVGSS
jgi:hypothetical protein